MILIIYVWLFGTPGQRRRLRMIRNNRRHRARSKGIFDIDPDLDPDYWDPDEHNRRAYDLYINQTTRVINASTGEILPPMVFTPSGYAQYRKERDRRTLDLTD